MSAQSFTIEVENLKCGGCATTITKTLSQMAGVTGVTVDPDIKSVSFIGEDSLRDSVVARLKSLGYPERAPRMVWMLAWQQPSPMFHAQSDVSADRTGLHSRLRPLADSPIEPRKFGLAQSRVRRRDSNRQDTGHGQG